ncbi:MAG: crossover junction endodeoxyribonuclease RuvC [Alphaproteobacteria bacterium]|nr:crossover junction endodeoxyribonuclease RuvC [Alphaproteobacteria bacterium]
MVILGIDPGLQKTGWGVIAQEGNRLSFIACGVITTQAQDALGMRLSSLHQALAQIIQDHCPTAAAIEETFVNKNPASALKLGQARGVALAVPGLFDIPVYEYAANKVKKALVGSGHADKAQVAKMVRLLLPGCASIPMSADAADALAVAICHAHYG